MYLCEIVEKLGLKALVKVKELMERHKENILNYFKHKVSNTISESLNSKIHLLKATACGFRGFKSCRARILFYFGKLDMQI